MAEILTESFCERCGTRYTFQTAAPRRGRLGRLRVATKGLRNYVLEDGSSLEDAFAEARGEEERAISGQQLEAFHKTFNFCLSCRQYTCANCWNPAENRCLSCAPDLSREVMPAPVAALMGTPFEPVDTAPERIVLADLAWPEIDLARPADGHEVEAAPEHVAEAEAEAEAERDAERQALEAETLAPEAAAQIEAEPVEAEASAEPEGLAEPEALAEPAALAPESAADIDGEPAAEAVGGEAVAAPVEVPEAGVAAEPEVEAEPIEAEAEPIEAEAEPIEAEAEPIEAEAEPIEAEAEPIAAEAEPIEAEAEPIAAEAAAEPEALGEPEAVATASEAESLEPEAAAPRTATEIEAAPIEAEAEPLYAGAWEPEVEPEPVELPSETLEAAASARSTIADAYPEPLPAEPDARAAAAVARTSALLGRFRPGQSLDAALEAFERGEDLPTLEAEAAPEPLDAETPTAASVESTEAVAAEVAEGPEVEPIAATAATEDVVEAEIETAPEPLVATREPEPAATAAAAETTLEPEPAPEPEPEPVAAAAAVEVEPAPEPAPPPGPAPVPEPVVPPRRDDRVEIPVWQIVAPDVGSPTAPERSPAWPPVVTPPPTSSPEWPATAWAVPEPPAVAVRAREQMWAESSRDVVARASTGVQSCVGCGLPLSATARFCRRCGARQG